MYKTHERTSCIIIVSRSPDVEQDCACADDCFPPRLLEICDSSDVAEGDCACPSPAPGTTKLISGQLRWKHAQSLHRISLPGDHELLFNPVSLGGPVVVNKAAQQLFDVFQQAQYLNDFPRKFSQIHPDQAVDTVRRFAAYGCLEPENCPQFAPMPSKAITLTAWLHLTNACNLHCDYCYLEKTAEKMKLEVGQRAVEAIFRSAVSHEYKKVKIKYAGGEALLNFPLILALHAKAKVLAQEHNLELDDVILTNGVLLSEQIIQHVQATGLRLSISLDGIGAEHDAQRHYRNGRGSFSAIARNLDMLETYNLKPSISVTVTNRSLAGLPQTIEHLLQRGLPFTINFYRENAYSVTQPDLSYQEDQLIEGMKATFVVIEKNLPPFSLLGILTDRAQLDKCHQRTCGVGQSYMVIDHNGHVAKCHMEIQQHVTDISDNDPLQSLRNDTQGIQNLVVDEKQGCRECIWRYWCTGGCPVLTKRITGRYDAKSPNCKIYQALLPEVLRLEGLRLLQYHS